MAAGVEESVWVVGGPIGVGILSTIHAARTNQLLVEGTHELTAQAGGYSASLIICVGLSIIVLGASFLLFRGLQSWRGQEDMSDAPNDA